MTKTETKELDTKEEEQPSANGHVEETGLELDDFAFISHIAAQKPVEELVEVPEWGKDGMPLKVLCKALSAPDRLTVHALAYDKETGITYYKRAEPEVVIFGSYNPTTGNKAFREDHKAMLLRPEHGAAVERLYFTIMRLSNMFATQQTKAKEKARKN